VEAATGPALQAAFMVMNPVGGKLLLFQTTPPNVGVGRIKMRDNQAFILVYQIWEMRDNQAFKPNSAAVGLAVPILVYQIWEMRDNQAFKPSSAAAGLAVPILVPKLGMCLRPCLRPEHLTGLQSPLPASVAQELGAPSLSVPCCAAPAASACCGFRV
jgi:Sec23/Sec24 trunk domain